MSKDDGGLSKDKREKRKSNPPPVKQKGNEKAEEFRHWLSVEIGINAEDAETVAQVLEAQKYGSKKEVMEDVELSDLERWGVPGRYAKLIMKSLVQVPSPSPSNFSNSPTGSSNSLQAHAPVVVRADKTESTTRRTHSKQSSKSHKEKERDKEKHQSRSKDSALDAPQKRSGSVSEGRAKASIEEASKHAEKSRETSLSLSHGGSKRSTNSPTFHSTVGRNWEENSTGISNVSETESVEYKTHDMRHGLQDFCNNLSAPQLNNDWLYMKGMQPKKTLHFTADRSSEGDSSLANLCDFLAEPQVNMDWLAMNSKGEKPVQKATSSKILDLSSVPVVNHDFQENTNLEEFCDFLSGPSAAGNDAWLSLNPAKSDKSLPALPSRPSSKAPLQHPHKSGKLERQAKNANSSKPTIEVISKVDQSTSAERILPPTKSKFLDLSSVPTVNNAAMDNAFGLEDFLAQPTRAASFGPERSLGDNDNGGPILAFRDPNLLSAAQTTSSTSTSGASSPPPRAKDMKSQKSRNSMSIADTINKVLQTSSTDVELPSHRESNGMQLNLGELLDTEKSHSLKRETSQSRDRHASSAKDTLSAVSDTFSAISPRKSNSVTSSGAGSSLLSRLPANIQAFQHDLTLLSNEEIFARFSLLTRMIYFLDPQYFIKSHVFSQLQPVLTVRDTHRILNKIGFNDLVAYTRPSELNDAGSSIFVVIKEAMPMADGIMNSARSSSSRGLMAQSGAMNLDSTQAEGTGHGEPARGDKDSSSLSSDQPGGMDRMFTYYFTQELEREKFALLAGATAQSTHLHFVFHDTRGKALSLGASGGLITNYTVISALVLDESVLLMESTITPTHARPYVEVPLGYFLTKSESKKSTLDAKKLQTFVEKVWGHTVVSLPDSAATSKALAGIETHRKKTLDAISIGLFYRRAGQLSREELSSNKSETASAPSKAFYDFLNYCGYKEEEATWRHLRVNWFVAPFEDDDGIRQKIGNAMFIMIYNDSDEPFDPTELYLGQISTVVCVIQPYKQASQPEEVPLYRLNFYFCFETRRVVDIVDLPRLLRQIENFNSHPHLPKDYAFPPQTVFDVIIAKFANAFPQILLLHPSFGSQFYTPIAFFLEKLVKEVHPSYHAKSVKRLHKESTSSNK